jgi:hypothetical protein
VIKRNGENYPAGYDLTEWAIALADRADAAIAERRWPASSSSSVVRRSPVKPRLPVLGAPHLPGEAYQALMKRGTHQGLHDSGAVGTRLGWPLMSIDPGHRTPQGFN